MSLFSVDDLTNLLSKLDSQRNQIIEQLEKVEKRDSKYYLPSGIQTKTIYWEPDMIVETYREQFYRYLDYGKQYHLVTLTFDPSISKRLSDIEQRESLNYIIRKFDKAQYFACFEKHQNYILHAHMLIVYDPIELTNHLNQYKSRITPKLRLHPAVNIKPVKQTNLDLNSAYDYIFKHKKDHPIYKDLIINI